MRYRGIERIMFLSSIEKIDHPVGKESTAIFLFEKKNESLKSYCREVRQRQNE